jgi:DNA-binding MarR family transcriptional regulator
MSRSTRKPAIATKRSSKGRRVAEQARQPTDDGQLTDDDYQRLLAFRSELRGFLRWSEEAAHDAGLTPSLHQLLLVIRGHPSPDGPTIGEAAHQLHIRHHSAVELAARGETAELLTRERDPTDHRQVHLGLTEHGRTQLESLTRGHLPRINALADTLEHVARAQTTDGSG